MKQKPQHTTPPKLAQRFLLWFLKDELAEEVLGDLDEKFYSALEKRSMRQARRNYWYQVLHYLRPFAFKKYRSKNSNTTAMFKHNLLISFRSFSRFKTTFAINLLGLACGLASALLIYLWVHDEMTKDTFHEQDSNRHVQVIHTYPTSGTYHTNTSGSTPNPLYWALAKQMPEVEYAVPVLGDAEYQGVLSSGERHERAQYQFIGESYFKIFPGDFAEGDKHKALSEKGNVVISKNLALSLFQSTEDAMGKTVEFKDEYYGGTYLVSGVFNPNADASKRYDMLLSYEHHVRQDQELMEWYNSGTQAHLVLNEGVDLDEFNVKLKTYLSTLSENWKDILYAQPYSERYLYGQYEEGMPQPGRIIYVRLFSIIALFVLIIACINYMNFSTAKASRRVKEIGVKKAIGAARKSLIVQYFSESLFMAFLSLIIAMMLVFLLLPQFNEITGKALTFSFSPNVIGAVLTITAITGLVSGIYPALYLSGFKSVVALKGKLKSDGKGLWVRKGLVVFQFAISVILIVSVIVIYRQVEFIQTTNLGYEKDHIITFPKEGNLKKEAEPFFAAIRSIPGVQKASQMSGDLPGGIYYSQGFKWEGMSEEDKSLRFYKIWGDYDLIELLGIKIKEGRNFSRDFATDNQAAILNETAIQLMNLENPIGQKLGNFNPRADTYDIIGVAEDFHFQSMQEKMKPLFFYLSDRAQKFIIKLKAGTERETLARIEEVYNEFNEGYPFEFKFMDDDYQALYAAEERITVLSKYFAGIAIAISCLGLLALTAFSTQRRFKEIAIRKVLGSSNLGIVRLLSGEFIWLVMLAIIIALPISFYLVQSWLENFAYRISLEPVYFVLAGILMLAVAWLTIMSQTAKSARVNVTEILKGE